jgi:hypothetical protein
MPGTQRIYATTGAGRLSMSSGGRVGGVIWWAELRDPLAAGNHTANAGKNPLENADQNPVNGYKPLAISGDPFEAGLPT